MSEVVKLDGLVPRELRVKSSSILLDSLEVEADIGFHDFEVGAPQRLLVTVEIWLDDFDPPAGDDPANAWDYDLLRNEICRIAGERRYNLQETLVHAIYQRFAAMRGVKALRVRSSKPDIYADARAVGVEIASYPRYRPD
ncbi:dihydroneopterin aldolase [Sphingomonas alba]|uniref:Dihydroneopterin aldolase n=1 Tax=Sphingomonas alba TaxID=2908208 RepID=A0ABT0RPJ8_9SPHN|nr:dihydroneopterin aldolase [Sphingomonas alba]MCL6684224.1 dihydroneopterin aldolase [Sphingomonas alba]